MANETAWVPWVIAVSASAAVLAIFKGGIWVGRVGTRLTALEKTLSEGLNELREDVKKILHWQASKTIDSGSPLRLTDIGKHASDVLDLPSVADDLLPMLTESAKGRDAYDIQQLCFDYVRDEYKPSPEFDARIKQHAFDNGLDRDEVLDVLAIALRDKLIALPNP